MNNIYLVIKHEIITTLSKRSFWVMTFLFPILILGLSIGTQTVGTKAIEEAAEIASSVEGTSSSVPIGYVDEPGVLDPLPSWVPAGYLRYYPNQAAANHDLQNGLINQFYLIPATFYQTGEFIMYDRNFEPIRSSSNAEIIENIISDSLIAKEPLGDLLKNPTERINGHALESPSSFDQDDPISFIVPLASLFIFFFSITSSAGFMLSSVTKEKESRTAEILLISLAPHQLMLGKVVGLGIVALMQMLIWLSGAFVALDNSNQILKALGDFSLPDGFLFTAVIFFIAGYLLYAAILGSIGVMAPNAREGSQFTFVAILPLLIPLWFNYAFSESPDGPLIIFLSMFPFTSPPSMMTRLILTDVPIWQILISILLLILTAYGFILLASRLFRADNLLSNEGLSFKRIYKGLQQKK